MNEDRIVKSSELKEELLKEGAPSEIYPTGFATLDKYLEGGVEIGELIIVSGPTSAGKTTFLMSITANMAKQGFDSCWFTLEVTPKQFLKKFIKADKYLPDFYIPRKDYEDADPLIIKAWENEHKKNFERMDWIEIKILEAIARAKADGKVLKGIFIDHIHQIFSISKVEKNISLELGDMVARIKHIAIQHNLIVFLIAHSKDDPMGTMREPRGTDIRDSGMITRLADTVILIWRVRNDAELTANRIKEIGAEDTKCKIRLDKNRRVGTRGNFFANHKDHYIYEPDDFEGLFPKTEDNQEDNKDDDE